MEGEDVIKLWMMKISRVSHFLLTSYPPIVWSSIDHQIWARVEGNMYMVSKLLWKLLSPQISRAIAFYRHYWILWLPWNRAQIVTKSNKSQNPISVKWSSHREGSQLGLSTQHQKQHELKKSLQIIDVFTDECPSNILWILSDKIAWYKWNYTNLKPKSHEKLSQNPIRPVTECNKATV